VHEAIQAEETGQAPGLTPAATEFGQASEVTSDVVEVGGDSTVVIEEVELMTCLLMECRLGGTLAEHPQYPLGQLQHSQEHLMTYHETEPIYPEVEGSVLS
jgi:hypothetical protein